MMRFPAIAACGAAFLAASPALAHAFLQTAVPPVGGTVTAAPAELRLGFTQEVEPDFSTVSVTDAAGAPVTSGGVHTMPGDAATLAVKLRRLPPGTYNVTWHVVSVDTHKTQGKFVFTVSH